MIYLISSIIASTCIFAIFRVFTRFKIDTFQAIVYNYFMACGFGFLLYGSELKPQAFEHLEWLPLVFICGLLFIVLFLVLGLSSQRNGVALTSVSVKMSMGMSLLLLIFWNDEQVTPLKVIGIVLALLGVLLMSVERGERKQQQGAVWMLLFLFVGCGMLDFSLNYAQNEVLDHLPSSLFSAFGFIISGTLGGGILIFDFIRKKRQFAWKNVLAGIILGVPNFFSIYLLIQSYREIDWSDSTVLAVTNISVVLLSAFTGIAFFREYLNLKKTLGLILSLAAILVLYFASST
ncbi:MAG: hypothetical protein EP338_05270 [Bacteroidetes bacterium]|nr:MAG: hypothetical protein EP338_05270 [Bacteroidota bacterium]